MAQTKRSYDQTRIQESEEAHDFTHHGVPGLKRNSGYINEEWHPKLRGSLARKKYREMEDNSPEVGASLWIIEALSRQATWTHEQNNSGHPLAQAGVEFSEQCFADMETPWKEHLAEALSSLVYGWCAMVPTFKIRRGNAKDPMLHSKHNDGKIGWRDWEPRAQESIERWVFDDAGAYLSTGRLLGMIQRDPNTGREHPIPLDRMLLFRNRPRKNNPEGRSQLRTCWRPYYKGMMTEDITTVGIERNVAGLPDYQVPVEVMNAKTGPNEAARQSAITLVKKTRMDQYFGVVRPSELDNKGMPTGYNFQLLSSSGKSFAATLPIIQHYGLRIFQNFMTEFMQLGQGSSSTSYSAHSDKTNLLGMAVDALLDMIDDVTNQQALPWLFEVNGFPQEALPTRKHSDIEKREVAATLAAVSQAVSSGAMEGDGDVNNFCRSLIDLDPSEGRPIGSMLQDAAMGANALGAITTQPPGQVPNTPPNLMVDAMGQPVAPAAEAAEGMTQSEGTQVVDPTEALNGAQVTSLVGILTSVASGELPRDTAIEVIEAAFPITRDRIMRMLDPITASNPMAAISASGQPIATPIGNPQAQPGDQLPLPVAEPEPEPEGDEYITLEEAAEKLRVSPQRLRAATKRAQIPGASIGNTIRYKWANVEALFESGQL